MRRFKAINSRTEEGAAWSLPLSNRSKMDALILNRASASRSSGEWNDDDFDALADGVVRIFKANAAPEGTPGGIAGVAPA